MLKPVSKFITVTLLILLFLSQSSHAEHKLLSSLWESGFIKGEVMSVVCDDVDGDYVHDVIYGLTHKVIVADFEETSLKIKTTLNLGLKTKIFRLNTGDWDQDGKIEILVTGFVSDRAYSWLYRIENNKFVLEQEFKKLILPLGKHLYTQSQQGGTSWSDRLGLLVIKKGHWIEERTSYQLAKGIGVDSLSLFNFVWFQKDFLGFTHEMRLLQIKNNGKKLYKSPMTYGTPVHYIQLKTKDPLGIQKETLFLAPQRMLIKGDEVIVVKNESYLKSAFGTVPNIKESQIITLKKTGLGFQEKSMTTRFPGAITDISFVDFNGDGQYEILASLLVKKNGFLSGQTRQDSIIVILNLP